jgi:hypothetical protein
MQSIFGFRGKDERLVELDAVSLVDNVFGYSRPVQMFQSYVLLMLL